ncbi:MAG: ABC transporter ATP-binding protein [Acidobacteriota bacterium]
MSSRSICAQGETGMARTNRSRLATYRRLLRLARPYWPHILGILTVSLIATPLALLTPLPLKLVVDNVIGSRPLPGFLQWMAPWLVHASSTGLLLFAAGLVVPIVVLSQLQSLTSTMLQTYTGQKLTLDFRALLFRHVQRLSLSYHDARGTTDSTYRIQYDAMAIQTFTISGVVPLFTAMATLAGMIYVTVRIDMDLALVALGVSPVLFVLTRIFRPRLRKRWKEVRELDSAAMSVLQETLSSLRLVKAFGREEHQHDRFISHSTKWMWVQIKVALYQGGFDLLVGVTIALSTAVALFVGVAHVRSGVLTLGGLLVVMSYLTQLYSPLKTLSKKVTNLESGLASAERAFSLLDELPEVAERPNARPLARAAGSIAFRDVSFEYEKDHPVLHGISFEIPAGARLGISGATGAGKTTLANLLMRFYDPTSGQILLDSVDSRDYKLADLRNQFAIVLQEPVLFSASVAQNIVYARPEATKQEIVAAATAANAHDFIARLPPSVHLRTATFGWNSRRDDRCRRSYRVRQRKGRVLLSERVYSEESVWSARSAFQTWRRLVPGSPG